MNLAVACLMMVIAFDDTGARTLVYLRRKPTMFPVLVSPIRNRSMESQ